MFTNKIAKICILKKMSVCSMKGRCKVIIRNNCSKMVIIEMSYTFRHFLDLLYIVHIFFFLLV